jgi:tetratricopeptide (TPR) repeat protein
MHRCDGLGHVMSQDEKSFPARYKLPSWPYAKEYVEASLDPDQIAEHGLAHLCRALDIGHVVAFVGSGTSISYGRVSWQGLVDKLKNSVVAEYKKEKEKKGNADTPLSDPTENIYKTLQTLSEGPDDASTTERYPTLFQVVEQLSLQLEAERKSETALTNDFVKEHHKRFRRMAMQFTYDDLEHARQLIRDALDIDIDDDKAASSSNPAEIFARTEPRNEDRQFRRDFFTPDRNTDDYWYLQFFTIKIAQELSKTIPNETKPPNPALRKFIMSLAMLSGVETGSGVGTKNLLPLHRFVVASLSLLTSSPCDPSSPISKVSKRPLVASRREIIPESRDPLALLAATLNIRRFLTTNFDLEIERMLEAAGYRFETGSSSVEKADRINPPKGRALDFSFKGEKAAQLIDFTMYDRSVDYQVCHLHGRAVDGEEEDLVVTAQDYNRAYVRNDETRHLVDESIKLAFGANPLFFVGHGMKEEDLLRPLRQFLSEKTPRTDRLAIALLPGIKNAQGRHREVISYFVLYGVYVLHSGAATIQRQSGATIKKTIDPNWLATIIDQASLVLNGIAHLETLVGLPRGEAGDRVNQIHKELTSINSQIQTRKSPSLDEDGTFSQSVVELDGVPAARGELAVSREIGLLNAAVELFLSMAPEPRAGGNTVNGIGALLDSPEYYRRVLKSLRIAVEGISDAIISASICAKLKSIHAEWLESSKEWVDQPEQRSVMFNTLPRFERDPALGVKQEYFAARHPVVPAPKFKNTETDPGRTFDAFLAAVNGHQAGHKRTRAVMRPGRRIFLVIGERGVGKGQFTTWFQQPREVARFLMACKGALGKKPPSNSSIRNYVKEQCHATLFINLSYSAEIGSIWDRLGELLLQIAQSVSKKAIRRDAGELSRHDKLAFALKLLNEHRIKQRILLFFNSVDILFDGDGFPKNAQIRRIFETLISPKYAAASIDLILVTEEGRLPVYFRRDEIYRDEPGIFASTRKAHQKREKEGVNVAVKLDAIERALHDENIGDRLASLERAWDGPLPRVRLDFIVRPQANEFTKRELLQRRERLHLNVEPMDEAAGKPAPEPLPDLVHFLRPANPFRYANLYHLALLMLLGLGGWKGLGKDVAIEELTWLQLTEVAGQLASIKIQDRKEGWIVKLVRNVYDEADIAGFAIRYVVALRGIKQLTGLGPSFADGFHKLLKSWKEREQVLQEEATRCLAILDDFYRDIGRNRFNMTVLLRAAERVCEESVFEQIDIDTESVSSNANPLVPVYDSTTSFLDTTLRRMLAGGSSQRDEVLLAEVIRQYGLMHAKNLRSPEVQTSGGGPPETRGQHSAAKFQLQQSILLHIALVGQPVEADVLACAPEIRDRAAGIVASTEINVGSSKTPAIRRLVGDQLDVLVARHLVFELAPDPRSAGGARRFALHRTVSRFVTRKLEGPLIDFSQADFFSVSLYTVQQRDIARPTAESYRFLRRLLIALISYPSGPPSVPMAPEAPDPQLEEISLIARCLHAAHGIVRAVFSVVVVSRFIDIEHLHADGTRHPGSFEEHRLFVRWMLKKAIEIDNKIKNLEDENKRKAPAKAATRKTKKSAGENPGWANAPLNSPRSIAPFFREQIVWLHNECGMFAQVQGDMNDAICHFDQALNYIASSRLEGRRSEGGALDARIRLNRAIAAIDCGLGREQLPDLHRIVETSDEHPAIRASALGWIGRIEQLAGNQATARESMGKAIRSLESLGHLRGASIFHRHMGSLAWQMKDKDKGRDHFRQAKALAEAGGHEDVRQYALLALVRSEADVEERTFRPQTARELQSIESYARAMGIARLESDVYRSRGYLLFYQGEVSLAGTYAERALEVATLKNLLLRKISAMILLARTYDERGHDEASVQLLTRAIELARKANYQIAIDRAEIALAKVGARLPSHKN